MSSGDFETFARMNPAGAAEAHRRSVERLAEAAFALQELRYLAWMTLKAFDNVSLRKAQHAALDGPMETMRAVLPKGDR